MSFKVPEQYRIQVPWGPRTQRGDLCGHFLIPAGVKRPYPLRIVASSAEFWQDAGLPGVPWEHVSVSTAVRTPTWEEMCLVKSLFWDEEDTVIQFHQARSEYVNMHPNCLHLWRPVGIELPKPPAITVGVLAEECR